MEYIENFQSKYPIDIFIETDIPSKKILTEQNKEYIKMAKNLIQKDIDYIGEMIDIAFTNYKQNNKKRYHFIDVRFNIKGHEELKSFSTIINFIYDRKIKISNKNLAELFDDEFMKNYVFSLINLNGFITDPDFNYKTNEFSVPEFFFKEYKKLYDSDRESLNKITLVLEKYLISFLDAFFDFPREDTNIDTINEIYWKGVIAGAAISDFYTICRIMKSSEFNNCIIYGGRAHYNSIQSYLNALGFKLEHEFTSDDDNFRCVQNVIDFNDFFKSN